MKKKIFLSYDLNIQGDYNNLYKWLDAHQAKECGDSLCFLVYDFKGVEKNDSTESTSAMLNEIKQDLKSNVSFGNSDRVYMISELFYNGGEQLAGAWLVGGRKASNPWDGFNKKEDEVPQVDE